ncbi:MAG: hypothetical protein ACJ748_16715, partial [Flavisolibacter sp.]
LPVKGFFFWPGRVELHFLPVVRVANKNAKELKEEVFVIMRDYMEAVNNLRRDGEVDRLTS